jgi:hypothetical protein
LEYKQHILCPKWFNERATRVTLALKVVYGEERFYDFFQDARDEIIDVQMDHDLDIRGAVEWLFDRVTVRHEFYLLAAFDLAFEEPPEPMVRFELN